MSNTNPTLIQRIIAVASEFLKAIWLYFPGLLFLIVGYVAIGKLTQGRDVIVQAAEHNISGGVMVLAVTFWAYITWYTSRVLTDQKYEDPSKLYQHLPRILGYACFIIPQIAIVNLPFLELSGLTWPLIIIAIVFYYLLNRFGEKGKGGSDVLMIVLILLISVLGTVINSLITKDNTTDFLKVLVVLYMLQAALFVYFNVTRRARIKKQEHPKGIQEFKTGLGKVSLRMAESERRFFQMFNFISFIGMVVYFLAIFYLPFARSVSSYTIVFMSFGVLLGVGNLISFISMRIGLNLHVVVIALAVISNFWLPDPYKVQLEKADGGNNGFENRLTLSEYTKAWVESRQDEILASEEYPMIFVLADGGASRSGYWTASCLGLLQDTNTKFDDHLFMLSGASGGSVGNGAFYALLDGDTQEGSYEADAKTFLGNDFLAFTISRMLGPDYFRHVFPITLWPMRDRASTLEQGMENPAKGRTDLFKKRMSNLTIRQGMSVDKPVLVINTTRMNDAKPGVISTVKLDTRFTKRLDVLGLMDTDCDMKLSTATVMGARFPYVSPGGELVDNNYFVDGGYFDNSGAGAAHESIQAIDFYLDNNLLQDSALNAQVAEKLKFYIVHLENSPAEVATTEQSPISPLANDLAAPIITLMSSYGQQTNVNNQRLYNFLDYERYPGTYDKEFPERHWIKVNLYDMAKPGETFSMNWVISQRDLSGMDVMVEENPNLKLVKDWLSNEKASRYGF